ncbi:MAG: FHA domain-containing protein [Planctomycetaceae bacterium]|nr:FHA domain-containing protein [Planctomycetaceae bacterium]
MARLVITDGSSSRTVDLTDASTVAGRAPENKIVIDDKQASRRHFQIDRVEFGFKVVDLESRNGTRVNDRSVNQALLRPGDRIQIGKHVLTFEDPNFKEPPAEISARLGPPPAAGRVEAPSSGPESSPDRAALPVAQEVKPAPVASPPPPPDSDYRTKRNRSGHTTAVQRNLQGQLKEEQKTLTMVAVCAGVFIFVVVLLIFLPSSPSGDAAAPSKSPTKTPTAADTALAELEAHEFEELSNYCERNRNVPASYAEIIKRVESFEQKYPRTLNAAKLKEYRSGALNGLKTSRNAEFSEAEKQAAEDLRKNDFGVGMKKIRDLLAKYKTDADIHERLVLLKEQAVEDARKYFQTKTLEADALKSSRKDEAREIYQSLLKSMGNGSVPEFDDYCRIARVTIEGLQ